MVIANGLVPTDGDVAPLQLDEKNVGLHGFVIPDGV
jgi:hypothetical protein